MRVAHIAGMNYACPPPDYGGTERSMAQMIAFQAALCAHDVTLYAPADSTIVGFTAVVSDAHGLASTLNDGGDSISIVNADGRTGAVRLRTTGHDSAEDRFHPELARRNDELFELLLSDERERPFDVIHNHDQKAMARVLIPAGVAHKALTHLHKASMKTSTGRHGYPLVCVSHSQARMLKKKSKVDAFAVVHHGIDRFTLRATAKPAGFLAWIAHFGKGKGAETAIEIARRAGMPIVLAGVLRDTAADREYFERDVKPLFDVTDLTFLDRIARMSPEEIDREIASLASRTGSSPPVIFAGPAGETQKQALFGNAIATLFPIRRPEAFGLVMIESMACGTPVVGTVKLGPLRFGAVKEIIEDGVTGFHVSARNEEDVVAQAVRAIQRLPELERSKVRAAFESEWSSERLAHGLDDVYRRFLSEPPPSSLWRRVWRRLTGGRR